MVIYGNFSSFYIKLIAKELTSGGGWLNIKTKKMSAIHIAMPECYTTSVSMLKHQSYEFGYFSLLLKISWHGLLLHYSILSIFFWLSCFIVHFTNNQLVTLYSNVAANVKLLFVFHISNGK